MAETRIKTGKVRFSYAHVFEPYSSEEGQDKKYSVAILIPKEDTKTLDKIEEAVKAAIESGKAKFGGKVPANLKLPLRDGDEERPDDPNYEGMMFMNASSKNKPGIVDANVEEIISQDEFYSGCWGRATVNFYAFNKAGNKGVACGLGNLQKLEDGDRLSGGPSAEQDFSSSDDLLD